MIKALIFDFDYTLGDSADGIVLSANYALERLGCSARSAADIKKTIGLSLEDTYFALTEKDDLLEAGRFAALFKEKADEVMVAHTKLYDGVKALLGKLKEKGCKTGIVTTKFHYRIVQILHKFAAEDLIDVIVGAEDVKEVKPDPEGLLLAAEKLGVDRTEVLYVGDSFVDAKTAEGAGIRFAGVLTGTTARETFARYPCVYLGETVSEVLHWITESKRAFAPPDESIDNINLQNFK